MTSTTVAPVAIALSSDGTRCRMEAAGVALEVDAARGARVTEFSFAGHNLLLDRSVHADNYGSTFWTSPQADWGWPPPPEIDRMPYRMHRDGTRIVFTGDASSTLGIAVSKSFEMHASGEVTIEYDIHNQSNAAVRVAPWEVTRVARRGVTLFPLEGLPDPSRCVPALEPRQAFGVVWLDHEQQRGGDGKLFADCEHGWLAHAVDRMLFVKSFEQVPQSAQAPGESAIELYVNERPPYLELEQQGAYVTLAAGDTCSWRVGWSLSQLPPHFVVASEDEALARLAASTGERLATHSRPQPGVQTRSADR